MVGSDDGHDAAISQAERFAQVARALECDEDEARWEKRLEAVAKHRLIDELGSPK